MAWEQLGSERTRPFLIAALAIAAALATRSLFDVLLPSLPPFASFLAAAAFAAYYGGKRAGIIATLASAPLGWYLFLDPRFSFSKPNPIEAVRLGIFLLAGVGVTYLAARVRHTQLEAHNSRQRLTLALAAGGLGVWDWDIVNDQLVWGQGFDAVNGRTGHQTPRTFAAFLQLVHPDDRKRVEAAVLAALDQDAPYDVEFRTTWPDGSLHWASRRGTVVRDDSGRPVRMIGVGADITDRKKTEAALLENEAQLRRYNEQLEQFAYAAAHDLQEPLRSVSIYSELLMRRLGSSLDPQNLEFLNHVNGGARRMSTLVKDLLRYTTAVDQEADLAPVDCTAAAHRAIQELTPVISQTNTAIQIQPLPEVHAFEPHIVQLFQNLISNAMKYRSPHRPPEVRVWAERCGAEWVIAVADNGIGIHPDYHQRIFGVFKRLHRHDEIEGTGIGLAIAKRIVEHHGGRIWVESQEGSGACFRFTLRAPPPAPFQRY
ncbi:MAG: PAS domain-containing protein [Bryobacterales bacterium]|nr:PAS domain-containing protein [Bryobacterales bacterium]